MKDVVPLVTELPYGIVYSDAEKKGGIGAVLYADGLCQWMAGVVPSSVSSKLKPRKTQIFLFEVIAAVAALKKWGKFLSGRRVVFFVDNLAARGSLATGRSSQRDVNGIIGLAWKLSIKYHMSLFFTWVPSALTISDGPSRGVALKGMPQVRLDIRWEVICAHIA